MGMAKWVRKLDTFSRSVLQTFSHYSETGVVYMSSKSCLDGGCDVDEFGNRKVSGKYKGVGCGFHAHTRVNICKWEKDGMHFFIPSPDG